MYKILLLDTDTNHIKSIKMFIAKSFPLLTVAKTMSVTKDLEPTRDALRYDIVLADFSFFSHSGIQTVKSMNAQNPNIVFIFYGVYLDTDYMKTCFLYGAIDYLYRPLKLPELTKSLTLAIEKCDHIKTQAAQKKQLEDGYTHDMALFINKSFMNILDSHLSGDHEIRNTMRYFKITMEPPFTVFSVQIDHFKKIILTLDEEEKNLLISKIKLIIDRNVTNGFSILYNLNAIVVIVGSAYTVDDTMQLCNTIKTSILDETSIRVSIGVGNTYEHYNDIGVSFREAKAALRYRCFLGYNTVITIKNVEYKNNITYRYPHHLERLLVNTAIIGEYDYCLTLVTKIFDSLRGAPVLPDYFLAHMLMKMIMAMNRYADEQYMPLDVLDGFFDMDTIFGLRDLDTAEQYFVACLKKLVDYIASMRHSREKTIFDTLTTYIAEHYYEPIQLASAALLVDCPPEYVNGLFKTFAKKPLPAYLHETRINIAKHLLQETNLDDKVIATKIGYSDIAHFRGVFKQHTGVQTHEFRAAKKGI